MIAQSQPLPFIRTSVGRKVLMAATGAILLLFVIGHLIGNLQVYSGPEALNGYAAFLRSIPRVLWPVRLVLLFCLTVHVVSAIQTTIQSMRGRRSPYRHARRHLAATWPSRTMRITGPLLLLYLIYHILHLTTGTVHSSFVEGDVYHNVVEGFSDPAVSALYIVAMLALGLHLVHGVWSMFQSVGLNNKSWTDRLRLLAVVATGLIVLGNISIPVAVLAGIIQ